MNERILITLSNGNDPKIGEVLGDSTILYSDKATAEVLASLDTIPLYIPALPKLSEQSLDAILDLVEGVVLTGAQSGCKSSVLW